MYKRTSPAWYFYRYFVIISFLSFPCQKTITAVCLLHLHCKSKRNVALCFGYAVSNTFSEKNTSCLEFCTFGVLSNTSSKKEHALSHILHFSGTFEHTSLGSCSEKEHALSQIEHVLSQFPHFFRTFRQSLSPARISSLPNLFFLLAISFSLTDQQHCQHKE